MHRGVALFGNNISYSISPIIHNTAFKIKNIPLVYLTADVHPDQFANAIDAALTLNFAGGNVTIPFKETVLQYTTSLSQTAEKIGAVNTLSFKNNGVYGDNTDSKGFYQAYMEELHLLKNKNVLLVGAGGAARALCDTLITKINPHQLFITNRNTERAQTLRDHLEQNYNFKQIELVPLTEKDVSQTADMVSGIIQATPIGSGNKTGQSPLPDSFRFSNNHIVIDTIYNPIETRLLEIARKAGARTRNGISMLLQQAAFSYLLWTGQQFPMNEVTPTVMDHIKNQRNRAE